MGIGGRKNRMSVGSEILSLRLDQSSSVSALLAALEWQCSAKNDAHILARRHAVMQAADLVLLKVAVHAVEMQEDPQVQPSHRAVVPFRRKHRRADAGSMSQRQHRLFA